MPALALLRPFLMQLPQLDCCSAAAAFNSSLDVSDNSEEHAPSTPS